MNTLRNNVRLIGRLGFDPELVEVSEGKKVAKLRLATNDYYKDSEGNRVEETQWHQVVAWNKLAELCHSYLKKGQEIAIDGKLSTRSYTDKEGIVRYATEILMDQFLIIQSPQPQNEKQEQKESSS